ncbi:hypothetical protein EV1_014557 [Malus domestica]
MSDPINWYQSQRSTVDLWFASVDPTLPAPWRSVMDEPSGLVFYWNPETNVSQYEHPNPAPPPPPLPPDHYQFPWYTPTFPSSDCTYRPPDYPASYMPELPIAPSYTSPIFLSHPAPPSVVYSDSTDVPEIPHSYATNPNFHNPQIYPPSSYEQDSWVFDSENPHSSHHYPPPLPTHDPHFTHPYSIPATLTMTIPDSAFLGTTKSPPAIKVTTAVLTHVLHRERLGKHVTSGTDSVSSQRVCQDMLQTPTTEGEEGIESPLEGLDLTLELNPSRVIDSASSTPGSTVASSRLSLYSPPLTSSVTKAPCSFSAVSIPSFAPESGSLPTAPMGSLLTTPHLPSWIPSSAPRQLRNHRVPPLLSISPLLTVMATPSRTRASVTVEGSHATNRSGNTSKQINRFLNTTSPVDINRKPKSGVLGYRQSKNSSHFSSSSVESSLCSYFCTAGLVHTVPVSPKVNVLQIAHPIHPLKEPDKARSCQLPILYSPLKKSRLHLAFIPHYMTFAMIVFNSYGSRRNILAHEVFDKRQKREIAQKVYPALSLHFPAWWFLKSVFLPRNVQRDIEIILLFQPTFLTGTFGWVSLCFVDSL